MTVSEGFQEACGILGVIGAIDGSHITIKPPADDEQSYYNRKKRHSIILQAVCDSEKVFTDVYAGWPGSTHDSRVLRNSPLFQKVEQNLQAVFPMQTFLVGDPAYEARSWMAPTLKRTAQNTPAKRKYSTTMSKARVFIEQAFALLKGRWRRLKSVDADIELIPSFVVACCVLHNLCLLEGEDCPDFMQEGEEEEDNFDGDVELGPGPLLPGGQGLIEHLTELAAAL